MQSRLCSVIADRRRLIIRPLRQTSKRKWFERALRDSFRGSCSSGSCADFPTPSLPAL